MTEKGSRAAYTLEFKLEAVRLVQGGQAKAVTAKILGVPAPTLGNWVRLAAQGNEHQMVTKVDAIDHDHRKNQFVELRLPLKNVLLYRV